MTIEEAQKIFEGTVKRHEQKKQRQIIQKNQAALALAEEKRDFALVKQLLLQQTETLREHKKLSAQPSDLLKPSLKTAEKPTVQIFAEDLKEDEGWT